MANVDTWLIAAKDTPRRLSGPTWIRGQFTTGTAIANADVVRLFQIPTNWIVAYAKIAHSATLGASATAQGRLQTTALTAATTAGAASAASSVATAPDEPNTSAGTDYFNILAGGANWGTSAVMTYEVLLEPVVPSREV